MYESRRHHPLTRRQFARRMLGHFLGASGLVFFSLGLGMAGFARFEGLPPLDAFLESAMLLGGMGPIHTPTTTWGKAFAGLYALYSGLIFIVAAGLILAPVVHRLLHRLHWEEKP